MALLSGFDELNSANATFSDWLTKTNELILLMRGANTAPSITSVMTANSLPGGSMTFGNATLFGQFTANTMVVLNEGGNDGSDDNVFANGNFGGLRGGNWDVVSNTISADTLYIVSNTTYTDESVEVYVDSTYGLIVEQNIEARHDVLFVGTGGSNTNPKMHWEDADNILSFNDDVRAVFGKDSGSEVIGGTGQMELFFTGGRMYGNTENLDLRANTDINVITDMFELKSDIGSELYISADVADNSTVKLYYEGVERLSTNTYGITVHGDAILEDDLVIFDNNKILMGGSTTYDGTQDLTTYKFQLFTDGSDAFIDAEDRDLYLRVKEGFELTTTGGAVHFITANTDGSSEVVLYNNGTARLETTGTQLGEVPGVEIFGEANTTTLRVRQDANFDNDTLNSNSVHWDATNEIWNYRDLVRATFGDGDDWEMFYDGVGTRAYSNTDNQDIRARTDLNVISNIVEIKSETGNELYMSADVADNSTVKLYYEGNVRLSTNTHGIEVDGDVVVKDNTVIFDNNKLLMGGTYPYTGGEAIADYNFQIYTDGTDGIIVSGDKDLNIFVHEGFNLTNEPGTVNFITANNDGSSEVVLYNNGTARLETTGSQAGEVPGVEIHGEANTDTLRVEGDVRFDGSNNGLTTTLNANNVEWTSLSNTMNFDDNTYLEFGTSGDFKIHHDGSHTYMQDTAGVGNVYLDTNTFIVRNAAGDENMIRALQDTSVALYYNNNIKLETTNIGVDIEGEANTDTLRVQSNAVFESDSVSPNEGALSWDSGSRVLDWKDDARARFGNGVELQIWHDSTTEHSFIAESNANGSLYIEGTNLILRATDDTNYITAVDGGSVSLFYAGDGANSVARVVTTNIGVNLEGEANTDTLRVQSDAVFESDALTANEAALTWTASSRIVNLNDNAKVSWGDGGDLQIFHDGSSSWIQEAGSGNLIVEGTNLILRATDDSRYIEGVDGSHVLIYSPDDDTVALTANNNQVHITDLANTNTLRVRSTSLFENNISIEGSTDANTLTWTKSSNTLNFDDNNFATFGNDGDLSLHHNGTNSFIENTTGELFVKGDGITLRSTTNEDYITADLNGGVVLYYDNSTTFSTTNTGATLIGTLIADGVTVGDNEIIQLGTTLQLFNDGANSYINESGTGPLYIQANNLILEATTGENYITGSAGAEVILYYNDNTKLTTADDGIDITGTLDVSSTLTVVGATNLQSNINVLGSDANNTLTWTTSSNTLNFDDNNYATFGTAGDMSLYHNGTNSFIENTTGELYVQSDQLTLRSVTNTEPFIVASVAGSVDLYYDGNKKIATANSGAIVTGTLVADGVTVGDDEIIQLGTTMQLYNDGANSYISETGTGDLNLQANSVVLETTTGENYFTGAAGGAATIYHNGLAKLTTASDGVDVTGSVDVSTNLTVTGSTILNGNVDLGDATDDDIDFNGRVATNIDPNANNTLDLGSNLLRWNDLFLGGTITALTGAFEGDITVSGNTGVTGDLSAANLSGAGANITAIDANNISTGTISDDRLPNSITSDITGNAATATQPAVTDQTADVDYRVTFAANTGTYRDLYADTTFLYNPNDNRLYVDNLTVNTALTLPDNISVDTINAVDFNVSNTATILNLEVTSLEANGVAFTGTGGDVTTTSATVIDSFPLTQTRGYKYFVHGEVTNDDTKGYAVEINVITTDTGGDGANTNIYYTRYGEVENGMTSVEIVPQLAANTTHIDLLATCPAATVSAVHRFNVLKIETRDNGV